MAHMGELYRKTFGNLRIRRGASKRVDIGKIEKQSTGGDISLDEAIKREQKRIADMKAEKKARRIAGLKRAGSVSLKVGKKGLQFARRLQSD